MRFNLDTRRDLLAVAGTPRMGIGSMLRSGQAGSLVDDDLLARGVAHSVSGPIVFALDSLSALPASERKRTLLFIPQSASKYWNILQSPSLCSEAVSVGPAVSGLAMLDGSPPVTCHVSTNYEMGGYPVRKRAQTAADIEPHTLCSAATAAGMQFVVRISQSADSSVTKDRIDCLNVR
jgi:hypothetical protein